MHRADSGYSSNILIGYLSYLRAHRLQAAHMSHAALALILGTSPFPPYHISSCRNLILHAERGRPVTRRVLAASSPLYQPMEPAQQLGYEVHIYARVPDTGDGADRIRKNGHANGTAPTRERVRIGASSKRRMD